MDKDDQHKLILQAIIDMKNDMAIKFVDMEKQFSNSIESIKEITSINIDTIKSEIASFKTQHREHYSEDKALRLLINEMINTHEHEDRAKDLEVDIKIDEIGRNQNTGLERVWGKVNEIENEQIKIRSEVIGKSKVGASIGTWVGFVFMLLGGLIMVFNFVNNGITP